ncbi:DHH family phosphoesterase [Mycoplasma sp. 'Moose RK']|uniref:DHH family phosphoesterase n=1 Tax=Mycoplasma sp. 'Moose RK' TaxID=2780095 RepID=UPI0018C295FC|nr:DHH family phosphoesterase [Mycoplasma sp. 'Moose RK']MBG0730640.1 DHH family phosphoesterase [Mycoplasma sp. 'Moose RK']
MKKYIFPFSLSFISFLLEMITLLIKVIFYEQFDFSLFFVISISIFGVFLASLIVGIVIFYRFVLKQNHFYFQKFDLINEANNLGIINLSSVYKITRVSPYVKNLYPERLVDRDIFYLFPQYKKIEDIPPKFEIKRGNNWFEIHFNKFFYWISYRDITLFKSISQGYENNSLVFAEVEVDNLVSSNFRSSDQDYSKIKIFINDFFEKLAQKYGFLYKEYADGRIMLILRYETFAIWQKNHFFIFSDNSTKIDNTTTVWLSVGFGLGTTNLVEVKRLANEALIFSKARGGNQVSIYSYGKRPFSYGSYSESLSLHSLVMLKRISRLLIEKLEKVDNIIIYGHTNSDLDSFGSAYVLGNFLKRYAQIIYKKKINFYIQNRTFDPTTTRFLAQTDILKKDIFISPTVASKITEASKVNDSCLVILVDVSDLERIENPKAFDHINLENVFVFDHHGISSKMQGLLELVNDYIDVSSSSTCEIITHLILLTFHSDLTIDQEWAQILLNGLYVDSSQFKKTATSSTFTAVSSLVRWGARTIKTAEFLKLTESESKIIKEIIEKAIEVKPGFFLSSLDKEIDSDLVSIACEQILLVKGRQAAFVVAKLPQQKSYKMSARSLEDVNVQYIAEQVGGGGNFASAAAYSTVESFNEFVENIKLAINRREYESNSN